jgi:hypothetical protein
MGLLSGRGTMCCTDLYKLYLLKLSYDNIVFCFSQFLSLSQLPQKSIWFKSGQKLLHIIIFLS